MLVVDDDVKYLEQAKHWMPGREVIVETDEDSVLDRVRTERPCLVILDLWLRGSHSGHDIGLAIKAEQPDLPVVVISAGLTVRATAVLSRQGLVDHLLPKQGEKTFEDILAHYERGLELDPWSDADETIDDVKQQFAARLVARYGGNKAKAARHAGVTWATLHRWLRGPANQSSE